MAPNISVTQRAQIKAYYESGWSVSQISDHMQISKVTVNKWKNSDNIEDHRINNQRPRLTDPQIDQNMVELITDNPFAPCSQIKNQLELDISLPTIRRRLHEYNLFSHKPACKIAFFPRHREARLNFAQRYLPLGVDYWKHVIFTDEKVFTSSTDGRKLVWRPPNSRYDQRYVLENHNSGRITCGFWSWMSLV